MWRVAYATLGILAALAMLVSAVQQHWSAAVSMLTTAVLMLQSYRLIRYEEWFERGDDE